jgi:hypothetical protein
MRRQDKVTLKWTKASIPRIQSAFNGSDEVYVGYVC